MELLFSWKTDFNETGGSGHTVQRVKEREGEGGGLRLVTVTMLLRNPASC